MEKGERDQKREQFARRLNELLEGRDVPKEQLAAALGCNVVTVVRWLSGRNLPHEAIALGVVRYFRDDKLASVYGLMTWKERPGSDSLCASVLSEVERVYSSLPNYKEQISMIGELEHLVKSYSTRIPDVD
jgi:transcriptional regulator with XRE-family HTH domain